MPNETGDDKDSLWAGNEGTLTQMLPANPAAPRLSRGNPALRDRVSRGISTAMEKGTVSALSAPHEVTLSTARFWWLHRCLLPPPGKCWLRGRLGVSNARSHCAVNKIKILPREENSSAEAGWCFSPEEFQVLSALSP